MNRLVQMNDSASSINQAQKMETSRQMTQGSGNDRRPDQFSSYPREFGQRRSFQTGTPIPTVTTPVVDANQGAGTTKRKVVHYFLTKNDDIELKTCANAWVPKCKRGEESNDRNSSGEKVTQIEEIRKKLLSILNKITPENKTQLNDSINSLSIETDEHLKSVIDLLFQKAIDEPNYTPLYAYICKVLHDKDGKSKNKMQKNTFKQLLTKCCQERFETMKVHEKKLAQSLKDLGDCDDQAMKTQMQSVYDQDERTHRRKSVGNCRFMCELYKVLIITSRTLETCVKYLLKSPNEETLECACHILKHAGKSLNNKAIFDQLSEYTSSAYRTRIPTRIKYMIMDTVELRDNGWVPRNVCSNTKVKPNAAKAENKPYTRIQNIPAVSPTKSNKKSIDPIGSKPSTTIKTENEHKNNVLEKCTKNSDLYNCSSSPLSLSDVVKGKNALVLPCVRPAEGDNTNNSQTFDDENTTIQDVQEKVRSILDNLTQENVVSSAKKILAIPIKTENCLKTIVDLLFQKAIDEPSLMPQYAHVCLMMKNVKILSTDQGTSSVSFQKLLIKMCQDTFEEIGTRKRLVAAARNLIESCKDKEIKKQRQSEFDQKEMVYRNRSVANCRFISELMKVKILAPPVLEICVLELQQSSKELSLECVCIILQHVGNAINHSGFFEKLREHSTTHKPSFSPRIRSMILDTLKLKDDNWMKRDEPQILVETKKDTCNESPITCTTTLPSTDQQPVLPAQNRIQPEFNVYKTVQSLIGNVTADNMISTVNELSVHIKNIDVMERTIDFLFERAKSYPEAIPDLVGVCSSLRNVTTTLAVDEQIKPTSLKKLIAIRCNKVLLAGIQKNPSENESAPRESYAFIGELFNENVLSAHIVLDFLKVLPEKLSNGALEDICILLKSAGKKIEQAYSLKKTVRKLTEMVSNDVQGIFSRRSGALLKALAGLRDKKWVL